MIGAGTWLSSHSGRMLGAALIGMLGSSALLGASAASAASPSVTDAASFSRDGVHFSADAGGALFDLGPIVPGQRESARLWVRNDGAAPLVIRVNATEVHVDDADYAQALSLRASTTTQPVNGSMTFATTEPCFLLLGEQYLLPGEVLPVAFRLAMADVDGSLAQSASAAATLAVGLRDASAPSVDDAECDGDGTHLPVLGDPDPEPSTPPEPTTPPAPTATPAPPVTPAPEPTASVDPTAPPTPAGAGPSGPLGGSLSSTGTDALTWLLASVALIAGGTLAVLLPLRSRPRRNP